MEYPQPPTDLKTDNNTATGILTGTTEAEQSNCHDVLVLTE